MATDIISYGFVPGEPTKKDLQPKPEARVPIVQIIHQPSDGQKLVWVLIGIMAFLAIIFLAQKIQAASAG